MIRGLYTAATGMNAMQQQIDVTSNNIANVNTTGFKKDRAEFQDLMYQTLNYTAGQTSQVTTNPTGIDVGLGVKISGIQKNLTEGDLETTGNDLDIAIAGNGFFKLEDPSTGDELYTRNGIFNIDAETGNLVNGNGYELTPTITIPTVATKVSIADDGSVTATDSSGNPVGGTQQIELSDFVNPAGLTPVGNTMFKESPASGEAQEENPKTDQYGSILQGSIENSNVSLVTEMVDLITAQRAYEANSKSITTTDSMLDTINRLKS